MASRSSELLDYIKKGRDKVIQTYETLPAYCQQEDIPELLEGLRENMKNYVILETKVCDLNSTKRKVAQELSKKDTSEEPISLEEISELMKTTYNREFEKHPVDFWQSDEMFSSMRDFEAELPAQQDKAMNSDEELAVTSETVQTTDPYTKQEFRDPVKNKKCGHIYEKCVIMQLLATNIHGQKCYWMGCKKQVRKEDLETDFELRRYMARMKARPI